MSDPRLEVIMTQNHHAGGPPGRRHVIHPTTTASGVDQKRLQALVDDEKVADGDTVVLRSATEAGEAMPWLIGYLPSPGELRSVVLPNPQPDGTLFSTTLQAVMKPIAGAGGLPGIGLFGVNSMYPVPFKPGVTLPYMPLFIHKSLAFVGDRDATGEPATVLTAPAIDRPSFLLAHAGKSVAFDGINFVAMSGVFVALGAPPSFRHCDFTECAVGPLLYLDDHLSYPHLDMASDEERFSDATKAEFLHCRWIRPMRDLPDAKQIPHALKVVGGSVEMFQCEFDNTGVTITGGVQPAFVYLGATRFYVGWQLTAADNNAPAVEQPIWRALTCQYAVQSEIKNCRFAFGGNNAHGIFVQPMMRPFLNVQNQTRETLFSWAGVCAAYTISGNQFVGQSSPLAAPGFATTIFGLGPGYTYGHRLIGNKFDECYSCNVFVNARAPATITDFSLEGNAFTTTAPLRENAVRFQSDVPATVSTLGGSVPGCRRETNRNVLTGNDYSRLSVPPGTRVIAFAAAGSPDMDAFARENKVLENKFPGPSPADARDVLRWVRIPTDPALGNETQFGRLRGKVVTRKDESELLPVERLPLPDQ